jgi:hypothetical protein
LRIYFNLPELVFTRVLKIINVSCDDKVDHTEWLNFFLKLTCGSLQHRLHLVFSIFDLTDNEFLRKECVKLLLSHFPLYDDDSRFGESFDDSVEAQMNKADLLREQIKDRDDVN